MLERIRSAVSFATGAGIKVAFFGVDSSRADLEFYRRAYETAVEAGAQEVVVVDTIGIATPEAAAYLVGQTVDWLGGEIPVHWHGHDDFGLGTAAAIAAVQAGATWVQGTINGMGERAGNADLLEVALALEALYGIPTRLDLTPGARAVPARAAAGGHAAAVVEGRHRRRALHARVGCGGGAVPRSAGDRALQLRARRRRRAGSCSARRAGSTRSRSPPSDSGCDVPEERRADLLAAVKQLGTEKGGLVSDDEFAALVAKG